MSYVRTPEHRRRQSEANLLRLEAIHGSFHNSKDLLSFISFGWQFLIAYLASCADQ